MENWKLKVFDELTTLELYQILQLRSRVFVVEQQCIYQDLDGKDLKAWHLFLKNHESDVIAYARLLAPGISYREASIGRILVDGRYRNKQLGKRLIDHSIKELLRLYHTKTIKISAQSHLKELYRSAGFKVVSKVPYLEDGIPHVERLYTQTK